MLKKQLRKSPKARIRKAKPAAASSPAALAYARAKALIARGQIVAARRLLLAIARVKGPYQARAIALLARLSRGVKLDPMRTGGFMLKPKKMSKKKAKKAATKRKPVKKARAPLRARKAKKKKGGGGGGWRDREFGRSIHTGEFLSPAAAHPSPAPPPGPTANGGKRTARAKPPAKPPARPGMIRRTPHMDIPPGAKAPKDSFTVEVYVDTKKARAGETSTDLEIEKEEGKETYVVDVWLAGSSHFIVEEPKTGNLTIDVSKDKSTSASFKARVANTIDDPAGAVLFAYFGYQGRPSGQVFRTVKLTPSKPVARTGGAPPRRPPTSGLLIAPGVPSADLTIEVTDPERTNQKLVCRVSSRLLKPEEQPQPENWYLQKESGAMVREYMKQFVDDKNHRAYSLLGAGMQLYKAAPESFKTLLWHLIDRGTPPASILVTSDEPNIPWELMVPSRKAKDGTQETLKPLGVQYRVGRWIRDDHQSPPPTVPLKDSYVIAPTYDTEPAPLAKSADEVALVLAAVPGATITPADLKNIKKQLSSGGRSLLHFICHGVDAEEGDVQAIFLDGGEERLTSLELPAIPQMAAAFKKRPMVFLNACEVGRPTVALTGIGGFAAAFLDLGASAVVAPLWSVKDTIAFEVAKTFYKATVSSPGGGARKGFAEIMQEIRSLAYDEEKGEDTYAAYCFYGDPNASVA